MQIKVFESRLLGLVGANNEANEKINGGVCAGMCKLLWAKKSTSVRDAFLFTMNGTIN